MNVLLRVQGNGESREFTFDRSEISIGAEPFNDIVLEQGCCGGVQGTLRLGETMRFSCGSSGVPTSLHRDGARLQEVAAEEVTELDLQPGDVLRFEARQPIDVHILERGEPAGPTLTVHEMPFEEELLRRTGPGCLWEATDVLSQDPRIETFLRIVAGLAPTFDAPMPRRLSLSLMTEEGGLDRDLFILDVQPGEDSGTEGQWTGPAPGSFEQKHSPLMSLGVDRRRVARRIEDGDRFAILEGRGEVFSFFSVLGDEPITGFLDVEFDVDVGAETVERIGALARLIQPLGRIVLSRAAQRLDSLSLQEENRYFRQRERRNYLFKDLICESEQMRAVYRKANDWVDDSEPVLIVGEAGTGKGLLARALHHLGPRTDQMLISLDCRELSEDVLDFELFGCVETELTGAVAPRKGVFEMADGGTVILEEIDLLSPSLQCKLTRVLKEGEVRRIGDAASRPVRARLVASTHRDLDELVNRGAFRRDLYLAMGDRRLKVPPLRERREDILPLARVFLRKFCDRYERKCAGFSDAVVERLREHRWSGNVRELQAVVESAVLNTRQEETIEVEHLTL